MSGDFIQYHEMNLKRTAMPAIVAQLLRSQHDPCPQQAKSICIYEFIHVFQSVDSMTALYIIYFLLLLLF